MAPAVIRERIDGYKGIVSKYVRFPPDSPCIFLLKRERREHGKNIGKELRRGKGKENKYEDSPYIKEKKGTIFPPFREMAEYTGDRAGPWIKSCC